MTAYKGWDETYPAAMEEHELASNSPSLIKEFRNEKIYPRPALTRHGVVFSYQPYEAGCFAEGILHFLIPYSEIGSYMKVAR
ncbi:MAG: RsiV family protein [Bacteroides sp.]|nr:RsiV family protein [Bacteroides sp.]